MPTANTARIVRLLSLILLCKAMCAQEPARPAPESLPQGTIAPYSVGGDWRTRSRLTGDWDGTRQYWIDHGLHIDIDWTQTMQRVTTGGVRVHGTYGGSVDALVRLDLARMDLVPGALLTLRTESRYGESVNSDSGMLLPVNTDGGFPLTKRPDEDLLLAITELNYLQFVSDSVGLVLGKIQTLDGDANEFASGRGRYQFMNFQLVANPVTALTVPYSALGAGVLLTGGPYWAVSSTVLSTGDASTTSGFDELDEGLTWTTEGSIQYRLGELPGGMNLAGIWAFDGDFNKVRGKLLYTPGVGVGIESSESSWAAYWSGWQYLFTMGEVPSSIDVTDGRADARGLGVFARFGIADEDTNFDEWSASVGLGGRGLIGDREEDSFGIGCFYNSLQKPRALLAPFVSDGSSGVEAYYQVAICRSVQLALDAQWVENAFSGLDDGFLIGARLDVRF